MPLRSKEETASIDCLFEQTSPFSLSLSSRSQLDKVAHSGDSVEVSKKRTPRQRTKQISILHFEIARIRHLLSAVEILLAQESKFGTSLYGSTSNRFSSRRSTPFLLIHPILVISTVDLSDLFQEILLV